MPICDNERPRSVSAPTICAKAPVLTAASSSAATVASRLLKASFTSMTCFRLDSKIIGIGRYCNVANAVSPAERGASAVNAAPCSPSLVSSWGDALPGRDLLRLRGKRGRLEVVDRDCMGVRNAERTSSSERPDITGKERKASFLLTLRYANYREVFNVAVSI